MIEGLKKLFWYLPYDTRRGLFGLIMNDKARRYRLMRHDVDATGASFSGFLTYKSIFVHIPKTAGLSINRTLFGNDGGGQIPLRNYQLAFSRKEFESFYKFTSVRNPWDRAYSAYCFLRNGGMTEADRRFARRYIEPCIDFDSFVKSYFSNDNALKAIHFMPQCLFVEDHKGNNLADSIGRFEHLQRDFTHICEKLDVIRKLDCHNVSERGDNYREFYTERSRSIIAEAYERDIRLYSYSF